MIKKKQNYYRFLFLSGIAGLSKEKSHQVISYKGLEKDACFVRVGADLDQLSN